MPQTGILCGEAGSDFPQRQWLYASEAALRVVASFGAPSPKTVIFRTRLPVGVTLGYNGKVKENEAVSPGEETAMK